MCTYLFHNKNVLLLMRLAYYPYNFALYGELKGELENEKYT